MKPGGERAVGLDCDLHPSETSRATPLTACEYKRAHFPPGTCVEYLRLRSPLGGRTLAERWLPSALEDDEQRTARVLSRSRRRAHSKRRRGSSAQDGEAERSGARVGTLEPPAGSDVTSTLSPWRSFARMPVAALPSARGTKRALVGSGFRPRRLIQTWYTRPSCGERSPARTSVADPSRTRSSPCASCETCARSMVAGYVAGLRSPPSTRM